MTKKELSIEIIGMIGSFKKYGCISLFSCVVNSKLNIRAEKITMSGLMRLKKSYLEDLYYQADVHRNIVLPSFKDEVK